MRKISVIIAVFLLCFSLSGCNADIEEQTTESTVAYNTDVNGELVPSFSEVQASVLDPSLYSWNENGRVTYNDSTVNTYTGVDVSVFQGDIDWEAVKADGIDFVMLRVGYRGYGSSGILGEDDNFRKNAENALNVGLKVGVYFFSQAINSAEAVEEANFVIGIIKDYDITYPVAYDWEIIDYDTARTDYMTGEQITECAYSFCKTVADAGYEPLIYFNCEVGYFNYDLNNLNDFHFWLAEYGDIPTFYYDYKIWQYTKSGTVNGISGEVDMNICVKNFASAGTVG